MFSYLSVIQSVILPRDSSCDHHRSCNGSHCTGTPLALSLPLGTDNRWPSLKHMQLVSGRYAPCLNDFFLVVVKSLLSKLIWKVYYNSVPCPPTYSDPSKMTCGIYWAEIHLWKLCKNLMFVNISNVMIACYPIRE